MVQVVQLTTIDGLKKWALADFHRTVRKVNLFLRGHCWQLLLDTL